MLRNLTFVLSVLVGSPSLETRVDQVCEFLLNEIVEVPDSTSLFALSIAAPEVMRYRELSNLMEVQALRLMYAELGSKKVDFSVGIFQMKPSFVEEVEQRLGRDSTLRIRFSSLLEYEAIAAPAIRQSRIGRILDPCISQQYLDAFTQLIVKEYSELLSCLSTPEKLHFIATVYNLGFGYDVQTIQKYQQQHHFPNGPRFQGEQYAFGELSVRIFDQLNNMLCTSSF